MNGELDPETKARRIMIGLIIASILLYAVVMAVPFIPDEDKNPGAKPKASPYPPYQKWALIVTVLYLPLPLMLWSLMIAMNHALEREGKLMSSIPRMASYMFSKRFDHKRARICQLTIVLGLIWYALAIIGLSAMASTR